MPFNFYEGWSEKELLDERRSIQNQLSSGRTTEVKLSNETVTTNDRTAQPLDTILERIQYALWIINPGNYSNPYADPGVTMQSYQ